MNNEQTARNTLSVRLKQAREYCGFSQEEVAGYLNLPRTAISLIESGSRRVEAFELRRLAKLYQTTMEDLTGGSQEESEPQLIGLMARAVAALSVTDRDEVLRYAQFLRSRKSDEQA